MMVSSPETMNASEMHLSMWREPRMIRLISSTLLLLMQVGCSKGPDQEPAQSNVNSRPRKAQAGVPNIVQSKLFLFTKVYSNDLSQRRQQRWRLAFVAGLFIGVGKTEYRSFTVGLAHKRQIHRQSQ